jgi:hypothetical protein
MSFGRKAVGKSQWTAVRGELLGWDPDPDAQDVLSNMRTILALEDNPRVDAAYAIATDDERSRQLPSHTLFKLWHVFRSSGMRVPPELATQVFGVIAEVRMESGMDLLMVCADGCARYFNFSGRTAEWRPDTTDEMGYIKDVTLAAIRIAGRVPPWRGPPPPIPSVGSARLNILTPSGVHFGEGKLALLNADALARPLLQAMLRILKIVTAAHRVTAEN